MPHNKKRIEEDTLIEGALKEYDMQKSAVVNRDIGFAEALDVLKNNQNLKRYKKILDERILRSSYEIDAINKGIDFLRSKQGKVG